MTCVCFDVKKTLIAKQTGTSTIILFASRTAPGIFWTRCLPARLLAWSDRKRRMDYRIVDRMYERGFGLWRWRGFQSCVFLSRSRSV